MPHFNPEWLGMGHGLIMGVFGKRRCPRGQRQAACSEKEIKDTHTIELLTPS